MWSTIIFFYTLWHAPNSTVYYKLQPLPRSSCSTVPTAPRCATLHRPDPSHHCIALGSHSFPPPSCSSCDYQISSQNGGCTHASNYMWSTITFFFYSLTHTPNSTVCYNMQPLPWSSSSIVPAKSCYIPQLLATTALPLVLIGSPHPYVGATIARPPPHIWSLIDRGHGPAFPIATLLCISWGRWVVVTTG